MQIQPDHSDTDTPRPCRHNETMRTQPHHADTSRPCRHRRSFRYGETIQMQQDHAVTESHGGMNTYGPYRPCRNSKTMRTYTVRPRRYSQTMQIQPDHADTARPCRYSQTMQTQPDTARPCRQIEAIQAITLHCDPEWHIIAPPPEVFMDSHGANAQCHSPSASCADSSHCV